MISAGNLNCYLNCPRKAFRVENFKTASELNFFHGDFTYIVLGGRQFFKTEISILSFLNFDQFDL